MTITATRYVLAVPNLAASAAFYRDVLGFNVSELAPGWMRYESGACVIHAGECADALPPRDLGDHSYFAYLVVDDIDAFHARLVSAGTELVKTLVDEPWGMRELGLRTTDGHRIMLGQHR